MNKTTRTPDEMTRRQVLAHTTKLVTTIDDATMDLEDWLLALSESGHWGDVPWSDLALAMGVSRQAVQQRYARLLANGARRRARLWGLDPNQLSLDDAVQESTRKVPPAKGRTA